MWYRVTRNPQVDGLSMRPPDLGCHIYLYIFKGIFIWNWDIFEVTFAIGHFCKFFLNLFVLTQFLLIIFNKQLKFYL